MYQTRMPATGNRYRYVRRFSGTGIHLIIKVGRQDIAEKQNPCETGHASPKLCEPAQYGKRSVSSDLTMTFREANSLPIRCYLRVVFICRPSVADLRHASEFVNFFCDVMEPNEYLIRVSIENIQQLASQCTIELETECHGKRQANKNSCFYAGKD